MDNVASGDKKPLKTGLNFFNPDGERGSFIRFTVDINFGVVNLRDPANDR